MNFIVPRPYIFFNLKVSRFFKQSFSCLHKNNCWCQDCDIEYRLIGLFLKVSNIDWFILNFTVTRVEIYLTAYTGPSTKRGPGGAMASLFCVSNISVFGIFTNTALSTMVPHLITYE